MIFDGSVNVLFSNLHPLNALVPINFKVVGKVNEPLHCEQFWKHSFGIVSIPAGMFVVVIVEFLKAATPNCVIVDGF